VKISYNFYKDHEKKSLVDLWSSVFNKSKKSSLNLIKWLISNNAGDLYLAKDDEKNIIVGSRAGWIWKFKYNNLVLNSIQFGLTAVSKDYRRLGIFSKLNVNYINHLKSKNIDFIYNVSLPNAKKGYEKLGWIYCDGIYRIIRFRFYPIFNLKKNSFKICNNFNSDFFSTLKKLNIYLNSKKLIPIHDKNFIIKRLSHDVDFKIYFTDEIIIIYKTKKQFGLKHIFVGEIFCDFKNPILLKKSIDNIQKIEKSFFINAYITNSHPLFKIKHKIGLWSIISKSPLGIKIINDKKISLQEIQNHIILSYIDLDTF